MDALMIGVSGLRGTIADRQVLRQGPADRSRQIEHFERAAGYRE